MLAPQLHCPSLWHLWTVILHNCRTICCRCVLHSFFLLAERLLPLVCISCTSTYPERPVVQTIPHCLPTLDHTPYQHTRPGPCYCCCCQTFSLLSHLCTVTSTHTHTHTHTLSARRHKAHKYHTNTCTHHTQAYKFHTQSHTHTHTHTHMWEIHTANYSWRLKVSM